MGELTKEQIQRQDIVDNACHKLLIELAVGPEVAAWDIENISIIRETAKEVIVDKLHLMTEMEFYPHMEDSV